MTRSEPPAEVIEALEWALDEIDVLSNRLVQWAYPQAMPMVGREDQFEKYRSARAALRASSSLGGRGGGVARPQTACAPQVLCSCMTCVDTRISEARAAGAAIHLTCPGPGVRGWKYGCHKCGNKRCPHHTSHLLECTGSNESGQPGSVFAAFPVAPSAEDADTLQVRGVSAEPQPPISSPAGALTAEKAETGWRSLETAPKSGNLRDGGGPEILLLTPGFARLGFWDGKYWRSVPGRYVLEATAWYPLPPVDALEQTYDSSRAQAPVAVLRSEPPSSARERREIIEECAQEADIVLKSNFMTRGAQLVDIVVPRIRALAALSSDGRGREKGNTSNSDDGIDPSPPATGKAESQ